MRTAIAQARSVTVSAEAVDSVLMPGSSFGTAPDVCIHHHRQKTKGGKEQSGPNLAFTLPPRNQAVDGKWAPEAASRGARLSGVGTSGSLRQAASFLELAPTPRSLP